MRLMHEMRRWLLGCYDRNSIGAGDVMCHRVGRGAIDTKSGTLDGGCNDCFVETYDKSG